MFTDGDGDDEDFFEASSVATTEDVDFFSAAVSKESKKFHPLASERFMDIVYVMESLFWRWRPKGTARISSIERRRAFPPPSRLGGVKIDPRALCKRDV